MAGIITVKSVTWLSDVWLVLVQRNQFILAG